MHLSKFVVLIFFVIICFVILFQDNIVTPIKAVNNISLESYCRNGYYEIPGEKKCSRAPLCGGAPYNNYDWVAQNIPQPDPNDCVDVSMVIGNPPDTNTPHGYFPLCCYEMERTGNFLKCVGYWERLWCAVSQCDNAKSKGATDSQCGGNCECAHATKSYGHSNIQPVSLEVRLNHAPLTATPTTIPGVSPTPTNSPSPTATVTPTPLPTFTPTPSPFPTTGPAKLPKSSASASAASPPNPPFCPSYIGCPEKPKGDANCSGSVDLADYNVWKLAYDTYVSGSKQNPNANFACVEGNSNTYFIDLSDFETYRRAFR